MNVINHTIGKYWFWGIILMLVGVLLFLFHEKMSWAGNLLRGINIENICLPFYHDDSGVGYCKWFTFYVLQIIS